MKMYRVLKGATAAVVFAAVSQTAFAADWVDDWKAFAAQTGEARHAQWAELIGQPEARALEKDWAAFRGYTASSLIAAENVPAEIKPGLVITKANIDSIPGLDKYLPKVWFDRLKSDWYPIKELRIVPTNHYYMERPVLEATETLKGKALSVDATGNIMGAEGQLAVLSDTGLPFTEPKNGLELNWLTVLHGVGVEDLMFDPISMYSCDGSNTQDRKYEAYIWWRKMAGRVDDAPLGNVPGFEGAQEAGALLITSPRDVRGLAGVRIRYADTDRDDDFKVFIPSLRRTRTLTGANGQDPIAAGLELTWDEWRSYWTKTDARKFDYELVREGFVLGQPETGHAYMPAQFTPDRCGADWVELELRPVWVLDINDKTGNYQYAKRRIYVDKELYYTQYTEMYDRRGELWRIWDDSRDWEPATGRAMWRDVFQWNIISNRASVLEMNAAWEKREAMNSSLFDIDQLRDYR